MTQQPQPGLTIPEPPQVYLRRARAMLLSGLMLLASGLVVGAIALVSLVEASALERRLMLHRVCGGFLSRAAAYGFSAGGVGGVSRELMEESP